MNRNKCKESYICASMENMGNSMNGPEDEIKASPILGLPLRAKCKVNVQQKSSYLVKVKSSRVYLVLLVLCTISPMSTADRATFLAALVKAKMSLNPTKKKPTKVCDECEFSCNSIGILNRHRDLMHEGRRPPPQQRGRKRKVEDHQDPLSQIDNPAKRQEGEEEAKLPLVNAVFLQESQGESQQSLQDSESENLLDSASSFLWTTLFSSNPQDT